MTQVLEVTTSARARFVTTHEAETDTAVSRDSPFWFCKFAVESALHLPIYVYANFVFCRVFRNAV